MEVDEQVSNTANASACNNNNNDRTTESAQTKDPAASAKKSRKRKKRIYNGIRETMEFYFSDANLSKDRFLMRLIDADPEVPLSVFMAFNKIKAMVSSVEEIEKAISSSDKLRLSEDRTKVARLADLSSLKSRSTDDCTIYVEALPTTATHDWVRRIFETYGAVAYVSLPKYRSSHRIKEFAFVEFEERASVLRAMTAFAEFGGALNATSDPDKLGSIIAFLREQEEADADEGAGDKAEQSSGTIAEPSKASGAEGECGNTEEPEPKKARLERDEDCATDESVAVAAKAEESDGDDDEDEEDEDDEDPSKAAETKGNKVRRKKTTSKHHQVKATVEVRLDTSISALRITTKQEWKRLRNKYLNQQRERVKQMKKQLWLSRQQGGSATVKPEAQPEHSGKMNFYASTQTLFAKRIDNANATDAATDPATAAPKKELPTAKAPLFTYEPGLIVQVTFAAPCVDVKDFKAEMRQHACVRYVDVKEGDLCAYLRLDAKESAADLMSKVAPLQCELVQGTAEEAYWQKIGSDRHQKLTKQLKVKPKRGREKVKAVAAAAAVALQVNHVRFDD